MPNTIKEIHRTWCKRCLDFTLHKWIKIDSSNSLICEDCKSEENGYTLSEIPEKKIFEQRERYKIMERKKFEKLLNIYKKPFMNILHMMSEPSQFIETVIIEDDAGQKYLNEQKTKAYDERKRLLNEMQNDYDLNYKHLNRNDKCACGSNKKYKQCHLSYFQMNNISKN